MARIIRCPKCDALWRLTEPAEGRCRCGACNCEFEPESAQTAEVPDEVLDLAVRAVGNRKAEPKAEAPAAAPAAATPRREAPKAADGYATERARELNAPSEEPPAEDVRYDVRESSGAAPMPAVYRTKKSGVKSFLLLVGILIATVAAAACAFLTMHEFVLAQAPYLRPVYEQVCTKAPCPGFVWTNAGAFTVQAELEADAERGMLRPSVRLTLVNASEHPQTLPVVEVKYLDPAGDVLAQRVLEPSDYGFPQKPAVLPAGESVSAVLTMKSELEYAAATAVATPVAALTR